MKKIDYAPPTPAQERFYVEFPIAFKIKGGAVKVLSFPKVQVENKDYGVFITYQNMGSAILVDKEGFCYWAVEIFNNRRRGPVKLKRMHWLKAIDKVRHDLDCAPLRSYKREWLVPGKKYEEYLEGVLTKFTFIRYYVIEVDGQLYELSEDELRKIHYSAYAE